MYGVGDVRRVATNIVSEKGEDYVYPRWETMCVYIDDDGPSCFVGRILDGLGFSHEMLRQMDSEVFVGISSEDHDKVQDEFTEDAIGFMVSLQSNQDCGLNWGSALELAKDTFPDE